MNLKSYFEMLRNISDLCLQKKNLSTYENILRDLLKDDFVDNRVKTINKTSRQGNLSHFIRSINS